MKKIRILIILFIISCFAIIRLYTQNSYKIFEVNDFNKVYVDLNQNLQKDKDELIVFDELEIPDNLTPEDKLLIGYLATEFSKHFLQNKYASLSKDTKHISINGKDFVEEISKTGLVINKNSRNDDIFYHKLEELHKENYVLVNTKSKKYHKLSCENGVKSAHYKLIPSKNITSAISPCKMCIALSKTPRKSVFKVLPNKLSSISSGNITIFPLALNEITAPVNECRTDACKALCKEIKEAKTQILFAVYGIHNQSEIFNALVEAANRGVDVRWVTDYSRTNDNYYPDTAKLKEKINDFVTDYKENSKTSEYIMHNKFFIFDSQKVFTGSANITQTDFTGFNANYAVLIDNCEIAKIYKQEFEQMYSGKFHNEKSKINSPKINLGNNTYIEVLFSPQDKIITKHIIPMIENAKKTIYLSAFYITHKKLYNSLVRAKERNVDIKVINDATNAANVHSIHKLLREAKIPVKTENYAGKMHSKAIVIDEKYTIIGSMNFTSAGETKNDENMLIIENPEIAKSITKSFKTIWDMIDDKYLKYDPPAESWQSKYSCEDGIDNDFDGLIDGIDPGCRKISR